jgi:tetratricopeptide (TPR) repeat protein
MKPHLSFSIIALFAFIFFVLRFNEKQKQSIFNLTEFKKKNIIRCGPDWDKLKDWLEEADIPPIPGAGTYKWKISTRNDSAQFYFNQGINMYYSFHIIEAMASFKKAEKFDKYSPMLLWAQALTYGPNINDFGYTASPEALSAIGKAIEFSGRCTDKEIALIEAQRIRYSYDSSQTRSMLNQLYVDKMKEVYEKFPHDADVATLYADAMMLQHPWDLWNIDGTPKPWTPLIREVLEKVLAKTPNHPGANHYYIHVMEPSPYAAKALPSADRLGKLNPGLSHVVHMPSHIYLRTGLYNKGIDVNINAVNSYKSSIPLYAAVTGADFLYIIHNLHMKANNAMLAGNYKIAEAAAIETRNSIQADYLSIPAPLGNVVQYIYMTPVLVYVRFGKWDELLQQNKPDDSQVYANILYHFGRGMAFSARSKMTEANQELAAMKTLMADTSLAIPFTPFSAAIEGAIVASKILSGSIALKSGKTNDAITDFTEAVKVEQKMIYNEPRDWLLNPKHWLGKAYLVAGDGSNAEKTFNADLQNNNNNGWALFGLNKALLMQKKYNEAAPVLTRYKKAFNKADINILSPVYQ